MYWTPACESNHKVYIQEQGFYGRLNGAVEITWAQEVNKGVKYKGNNNINNDNNTSKEFVSFHQFDKTLIYFPLLHPVNLI